MRGGAGGGRGGEVKSCIFKEREKRKRTERRGREEKNEERKKNKVLGCACPNVAGCCYACAKEMRNFVAGHGLWTRLRDIFCGSTKVALKK